MKKVDDEHLTHRTLAIHHGVLNIITDCKKIRRQKSAEAAAISTSEDSHCFIKTVPIVFKPWHLAFADQLLFGLLLSLGTFFPNFFPLVELLPTILSPRACGFTLAAAEVGDIEHFMQHGFVRSKDSYPKLIVLTFSSECPWAHEKCKPMVINELISMAGEFTNSQIMTVLNSVSR